MSILPRSVCLDELKKKKLVVLPVENLSMVREINLAYQSDFTQTDMLRDIVRSYRETLRHYRKAQKKEGPEGAPLFAHFVSAHR